VQVQQHTYAKKGDYSIHTFFRIILVASKATNKISSPKLINQEPQATSKKLFFAPEMKQKKLVIFSSSKKLQPPSGRTMAGEKSSPGESSKPEGLRPGGTVNRDAPADEDAGGATESAGPALATPPPPVCASCCCCCCCGGGAREPVSSCVKVAAPAAEEEAPPGPPPPSASDGKSAEASVSGPGLASPAPVKSDSAVERGGSARRGRGGGGGRADMVAGGKRGILEGERERIPLFLVFGVDFGLCR
jgi:hypothetical protein